MHPTFPAYSISKPFLAQAVIELGVPLDGRVGDFIRGLGEPYESRRIGSLLNHSSGLSDYAELPDYRDAVAKSGSAWSRDELLERCEGLPNDHKGFHYSNVGYLLLRMLVELETQRSMFDAMNELVLKPLQIEGFTEWETRSGLVEGYDPRWVYSGTFVAREPELLDGFLKLVRHREQTTGLATLAVEVPYPNTGFDHPAYGLGLMLDKSPDATQPTFVGHGGGGPGYSHMILVNTSTWKVALETSRSGFNQTDAIIRLREETSR
jgi:D-alanyl-D-alanine carboxypeptidase